MIDPIALKAAAQGVRSFGAVLDKFLGPTAEEMGKDLLDSYTRRRNVRRVAARAVERSSLEADGTIPDGAIPARVAAELFDKAQWADDEFVAEYLSGVLASARTAEGRNDSGVSWTALVGRLSSDQLALHWAIYSGFQQRVRGRERDDFWTLVGKQIVIDYEQLFTTLEWPLTTEAELARVMDAAYGLRREGLLSDLTHGTGGYLADDVTWTKGRKLDHDAGYLSYKVTSDGVGLLLHAVGEGELWYGDVGGERATLAVDATSALPRGESTTFIDDIPMAAEGDGLIET
ncbi:hypothetical protein [Cryobacterium sp. Hz9]|uniref:hypothetical protein n=1 Tax=Cryobacterium sp. Hz9 TaxID=1259167 RepID=UPI00106BD03F|nr:hypothetical protein [Cryobacterium sp. Hz9]TFB66844.1 hypothetical protein E3N85_09740 [Cryobacterium sp. Hz9]